MIRNRRLFIGWAAITLVTSNGCDSLWVYDSPRPHLKGNDKFEATPPCPDLVIDPKALAAPSRRITLTGRRYETGLGAESVPVQVRIGPCCGVPSGSDAEPQSTIETSLGPLLERSAGEQMCSAEAATAGCSSGLNALNSTTGRGFELVAPEHRGCRARSSSHLECLLDPNGEAEFDVRGQLDFDELALVSAYLPVCVKPHDDSTPDGGGKSHATEVRVVPRPGTARFALAVVKLHDVVPPVPFEAMCESVLQCGDLRPRAKFQAGVVSVDIPRSSIDERDFLAVAREVPLTVQLLTLTAPSSDPNRVFLATDENCRATDTGSTTLSLSIRPGESTTASFFLCGPAHAAVYRLTVSGNDRGAQGSDAGSATVASNALVTHPLEVQVTALAKRYFADRSGGQRILSAENCEGMQSRVPVAAVRLVPPLVGDSESVVINCPGLPPGDAAVADAANPEGDGAVCNPVRVELKPGDLTLGGTCLLTVPND
jgi:hypothetical protein